LTRRWPRAKEIGPEPTTKAGKALLERLTPNAPSDLSEENFFTRDTMAWARDITRDALPAIEAEAVEQWLASPEAEERLRQALVAELEVFQAQPESFDNPTVIARFILAAMREAKP
jgi:hypothetical protein